MQGYSRLQLIFEGNILEVILNRPEKRNAIDRLMAEELMDVLRYGQQNNDVRVMVLRGRGQTFCAGADLNYMNSQDHTGEKRPAAILARLFHSLYHFPKPLLVIAHGKSMGGALGLIAAADFVLAPEEATFAFSEVKLGLVPATISPYVIKRTGEKNARQLMLLGDSFSAAEAIKAGLVDKTGDPGELEAYKSYLCSHFESNAPQAMMNCKKTIQYIANVKLDDHAIAYTLKVLDDTRKSPEAREGMQAFFEKRKAGWQK